jgi:hypothetical protein
MSEKTREEYEQELAALAGGLLSSPHLKIPSVPCADLILSQVRNDPEIETFGRQYFGAGPHSYLTAEELGTLDCAGVQEGDTRVRLQPLPGCLPPACVTLGGIRGSATYVAAPANGIRRLFVGDLVWLFFMERMGLFQMQGRLADDYALRGTFPLSNNTLTSVILEAMVRQMKSGLASSVRDRASAYRRCLGWTTDTARKLGLDTEVNTGFDRLFHKFLRLALAYYEAKRLAAAIQQTTTGGASAATRVSVKETLVLLRKNMELFEYGRNNYNTLNGIVYTIGSLDLVRNLKDQIGIPSTYNDASEYISAAYAKLIEGGDSSASRPNRYLLHLSCAESGRDLLLDIQVLNVNDVGAVSLWLDNEVVEERVENYRTAYRELAGVDLKQEGAQIVQAV